MSTQIQANDKSPLGLMWRGLVMGLAEVVPGVSGGTMALITGIYHTLITTIASFGPSSLRLLSDWRQFIAVHNIPFLLWLGLGMGVGVLLFASLMQYLLANFAPVVWAFFCGVITASAIVIARQQSLRHLLVWGPAGLLFGLLVVTSQVGDGGGEAGKLMIFVGGAIAICAWLLPAISGSFILLLLGLYDNFIQALAAFDVIFLATIGLGMVSGLLLFSRLLAYLIAHHAGAVFSLFCGFMVGSLLKLWPWQVSTNMLPNAQQADWLAAYVSPASFVQQQQQESYVLLCCVFFVFGGLLIFVMSKATQSGTIPQPNNTDKLD